MRLGDVCSILLSYVGAAPCCSVWEQMVSFILPQEQGECKYFVCLGAELVI